MILNHLGQPVGISLPSWTARQHPSREPIPGRLCHVEPIDPARHGADLFAANAKDREGRNWTYLSVGPFETFETYLTWLEEVAGNDDPLFYAIIDTASACAVGVASYLRVDPSNGAIEIGNINFSPELQRRPAATEAIYLMMRRAFDELRYRRCEWKCDALNAASRKAAERLGFEFEGVFRQAMVYKGRNRDTAWYSVIDREWPMLRQALERWLDSSNFDHQGRQRQRLSTLTAAARAHGNT